MPNLDIALSTILQYLADFFGMTTNAIMENAIPLLTKYAWYTLPLSCVGAALLGALVGFIIGALAWFVIMISSIVDDTNKLGLEFLVVFIILGSIVGLSIVIIPCIIAPEIRGLEMALKLFQ